MHVTLPTWNMVGIVQEIRGLTDKHEKVWMHVCKVAAVGGTFELQTRDGDKFKKVGEGMTVQASGTFDEFNGSLKLTVQAITEDKAA